VDGAVLNEATHVVKGEEVAIDNRGHDIGVVLEDGMADDTADATKTLYSNIDSRG
jgi:hypothetical protein